MIRRDWLWFAPVLVVSAALAHFRPVPPPAGPQFPPPALIWIDRDGGDTFAFRVRAGANGTLTWKGVGIGSAAMDGGHESFTIYARGTGASGLMTAAQFAGVRASIVRLLPRSASSCPKDPRMPSLEIRLADFDGYVDGDKADELRAWERTSFLEIAHRAMKSPDMADPSIWSTVEPTIDF